MRRFARAVVATMLVALACLTVAGCAGTRGTQQMSDDPVMIQKEIVELDREISNTEEMLKSSKTQLQMEDSQQLRDDIRSLEMSLIHLESQKRALEERLAEIRAQEGT